MLIGKLEIITFRTTRNDNPAFYPLKGLLLGISSGHIALRFIIDLKHKAIFEEFVKKYPSIPHKICKHGCEIYFSYWPRDWQRDLTSTLVEHRYDCEQSANLSPFQYNEKFKTYLQPVIRIICSPMPMMSNYLWKMVTLPPGIILHTSRLEANHGKYYAKIATIYAQIYSVWRKNVVNLRNMEKLDIPNKEIYNKLIKLNLIAKASLHACENILHRSISDLEEYITYGNPERDVVTLPLHLNQLISMLKAILHIADNPTIYKYNFFKSNCAHISVHTLTHAFKEEFKLARFLGGLGIPITPTFILQNAASIVNATAAHDVANATRYTPLPP